MRTLFYLVISLQMYSCFENVTYEKPENLIPKDKMVEILSEFIIINSAQGNNKKVIENQIKYPVKYIYNKYSIDSAQFDESNAYYSANVEIYSSIYDSVKLRLEKRKEVIENKINKRKKTSDSIKNNERKRSDRNKFISRKIFPGNKIDTTFRKSQELK